MRRLGCLGFLDSPLVTKNQTLWWVWNRNRSRNRKRRRNRKRSRNRKRNRNRSRSRDDRRRRCRTVRCRPWIPSCYGHYGNRRDYKRRNVRLSYLSTTVFCSWRSRGLHNEGIISERSRQRLFIRQKDGTRRFFLLLVLWLVLFEGLSVRVLASRKLTYGTLKKKKKKVSFVFRTPSGVQV